MKPRIARVPSAKLRSSVSMDFISPQGIKRKIQKLCYLVCLMLHLCFLCCQGLSQRNELSYDVGVVGQRVTYSNGTIKTEEETTGPSPPLVKPALRESVRALKPHKGQSAVISNWAEFFFLCFLGNNTLYASIKSSPLIFRISEPRQQELTSHRYA